MYLHATEVLMLGKRGSDGQFDSLSLRKARGPVLHGLKDLCSTVHVLPIENLLCFINK